MPRARTTKKLAQRIDLHYFKQAHPLRRARFLLAVGATLVAVLWLAWLGLAHNRWPYSSGPMASVHAVFGLDCSACHIVEKGRFQLAADDHACLECHDGPIHHANQKFTPRCAECHTEHQGRINLTHTRDAACTRCHASLETRAGASKFARDIEGFNTKHPEFAPLRAGFADPGTIKLNHSVHLKPDLRGPDGKLVKLECGDCHRPPTAVRATWRFGTPGLRMVIASGRPTPLVAATDTSRAYMVPPTFANTCIGCHPLPFDPRIAEPVPHDTPEVVHAFVVKKLGEYIAGHPEELRGVSPQPSPALPGRPQPPSRAMTQSQWLAQRLAEDEDLLWRKTCKECHALSQPAGAMLPSVAKSNITTIWLPHSRFDHEAHQMLACQSCHTKALTSRETADVLVPGIATCQQCHHPGVEAAAAGCFECHTYHDWSQRKEINGRYTIQELVRGVPAPPAGTASPESPKTQ